MQSGPFKVGFENVSKVKHPLSAKVAKLIPNTFYKSDRLEEPCPWEAADTDLVYFILSQGTCPL